MTENDTTSQLTYEPPVLTDLGDARALTLGSAQNDTADMSSSRYN